MTFRFPYIFFSGAYNLSSLIINYYRHWLQCFLLLLLNHLFQFYFYLIFIFYSFILFCYVAYIVVDQLKIFVSNDDDDYDDDVKLSEVL